MRWLASAVLGAVTCGATLPAIADQDGSQPPRRALIELAAARWRHDLAWRLSSDDVLFGDIAAVKRLGDGVIAVADQQLGQILLVAQDGAVQQIVPVSGEGPGRVARLAGVEEMPPDRLLLVQAWPGRVEVVRRDGTPLHSLVLGGRSDKTGVATLLSLVCAHGQAAGVLAHVRFLDHQRSTNTVRLSTFDSDLIPVWDIFKRENVTIDRMGLVDETEMDVPIHAWNIVDERHIVVAPEREHYRLELHEPGRGLREVFSRERAPLPRPESEKQRLRSQFTLEVDGRRQAIEFVFFETAQMIQEIAVLGPRLLLLGTAYRYVGLPAGSTARLDLVDLDAASVREIRLSVPIDPDRDRLLPLPGNDLVVLVGAAAFSAGPRSHQEHDIVVPAIEYWRYVGEQP